MTLHRLVIHPMKNIDKGILKFVDKPIGVDTNPFPEVSLNIVTPDLSKLTGPRSNVDLR